MPNLLHFPWIRRLLGRGVNSDVRPELMPDGLAREAVNFRPTSIAGNTGSASAIGGEEVASFETLQPSLLYQCIGAASCNGHMVEFWAGDGQDSFIKIDGVIVAQSPNIPYRYDRPLQLAVVEDVRRGVIYPADHASDALYWDVDDLLLNVGNDVYFSAYTTDLNSVLLTTNPEFPEHVGNYETSPGLAAGQYQYRLRYVSPLGDRSNSGPETPLVTVPIWQDRKMTWQQGSFPGLSTVGGPISPLTPTGYGVTLKFRVDNQQGYSFVEILRTKYTDGLGAGITEVVAKIGIVPGQVSIQTFNDPTDAIALPEVVPADEVGPRLITFTAAKAVEYADRRVTYGNFSTGTRDSGITFTEVDGNKMVPITAGVYTQPDSNFSSIYNDGYSDPVNNTYMKSYMRGEAYGLGVMVWDKYSSRYYVTELYDSYQFPNRRDPKQGDSLNLSDTPTWAANTNCNGQDPTIPLVTATFDAFDQGQVTKFPLPTPGTGYNFINMATDAGAQAPWGPTDPVQSGINGLNDQTRVDMSPVTQASLGGVDDTVVYSDMTERMWAPQYQALGGAIYGVDNLPRGAKVLSIMRTEPANKVVAQAIAAYQLKEDEPFDTSAATRTRRDRWALNLDIPDFKSFKVDQATQDELIANPQNFKLQFVSPLGVASVPFGWTYPGNEGPDNYTGLFPDMITYAGIQYDQGQVNVGEPLFGMAYQATGGSPAPLSNYIGYDAWRGQVPSPGGGPWHMPGGDQGNTLIDIDSADQVIDGRSSFVRVVCSTPIYNEEYLAGTETFDSAVTRAYHQPFYVVNLIRVNATVPDLTIDQYINTGYHIKLDTCIGVSTGGNDSFELLNERWEDVISGDILQTRYVWVQQGGNEAQAWLQINGSQFMAIAPNILFDIGLYGFWTAPDGTQVYGICVANIGTATSSGRRATVTTVSFGLWGSVPLPVPPVNSRILVRYNKNAPIKFFGGDCTIAPSLGCFVDGTIAYDPAAPLMQQFTAAGTSLNVLPRLPYIGYRKNPGYRLPIQTQIPYTEVGDYARTLFGLRQWCVLWDAEQRASIKYGIATASAGGPYQWPTLGYAIKPYIYDSNNPTNGMYTYPNIMVGGVPVTQITDFARGGIPFADAYNQDYWKQSGVTGFGIPYDDQGGIQERTTYPTGLICSLEVDPILTDVPGIRTFIDANLKVLSEENGEIKTMGTALGQGGGNIYTLGQGGRNIYTFHDRGVARVLTAKNILTGASGEQISTMVISNYWGDEMWLSRSIGSPDQMWRLLAKSTALAGKGYADSFFWPDRNSWYRLTGDQIIDIGHEKFIAETLPALTLYPVGYGANMLKASSGYDRRYNEAYFSIMIPQDPVDGQQSRPRRGVYVYSPDTNEWIGRYTYDMDQYSMLNGRFYGFRNSQCFKLDEGYTISGNIRESSITVPMVGDVGMFKEFCRGRVTGSKPDRIEILDQNFNVIVRKDAVINNSPYWDKAYDGWEFWADRVLASVDPARPLPQDQFFYLRCIWSTASAKQAVALSGQLKLIK